jgi:hypothetical protein
MQSQWQSRFDDLTQMQPKLSFQNYNIYSQCMKLRVQCEWFIPNIH